jgi:hypothetical protein
MGMGFGGFLVTALLIGRCFSGQGLLGSLPLLVLNVKLAATPDDGAARIGCAHFFRDFFWLAA